MCVCTWVCFIKGMGKGGFFLCLYIFALFFFLVVWEWGGGRLGGIRVLFVCYFVLVLMQLVSTKGRIDSYFSQLGFV